MAQSIMSEWTSSIFPPLHKADEDGLLAVGGDLSPEMLIEAYSHGIFPWFSEGEPILWWSPDPRMVLFPERLKISKSMKQLLNKNAFSVSYDREFEAVMENCKSAERKDQEGTWITEDMKQAYMKLYEIGLAHSVEVWNDDDELVGGLYGVSLGKVFFGESMFSKISNASKYGFIKLVKNLEKNDFKIIDCQVYTKHLESLGAELISRNEFIQFVQFEIGVPTRTINWSNNFAD